MIGTNRLNSAEDFTASLFKELRMIQPGVDDLAFYEFRYALENYFPAKGWESINLIPTEEITRCEELIQRKA